MRTFGSADKGNAPVDIQAREAWLYMVSGHRGWFKKESDKDWIETTADGEEFTFVETRRTAEYVELFDKSRTMWLRLSCRPRRLAAGRPARMEQPLQWPLGRRARSA